jgi:hypothetical protein
MTNLTLAGWKTTVSIGLIQELPLQDQASALVLTENYLASTGGWVPDDAGDPTGPGVPASGVTTGEAIIVIAQNNLGRIYSFSLQGVLTFNMEYNRNLDPTFSDATALSVIEPALRDFIELQFVDTETNLEFVTLDSYDGPIIRGTTTAEERRGIQTAITTGGKLINPKAIALSSARARFNADNTFNVSYLYTEEDKELFHLIIKYTDTTYESIDPTATNQFAIKLDSVSYKVNTGQILSV